MSVCVCVCCVEWCVRFCVLSEVHVIIVNRLIRMNEEVNVVQKLYG